MGRNLGKNRDNFAEVIVPQGIKKGDLPSDSELEVAWLLARHYVVTVEFMPVRNGYQLKTPDFMMMGKAWELKQPVHGEDSIERRLKTASKQAKNVVIDCRAVKLSEGKIVKVVMALYGKQRTIRHLIVILSDDELLDFRK